MKDSFSNCIHKKEFKRVNGHCNVPQKYEKNSSLGAWVARQRLIMRQWEETGEGKRHGRDTPTGERAERLKNLGLESSIGKCKHWNCFKYHHPAHDSNYLHT